MTLNIGTIHSITHLRVLLIDPFSCRHWQYFSIGISKHPLVNGDPAGRAREKYQERDKILILISSSLY